MGGESKERGFDPVHFYYGSTHTGAGGESKTTRSIAPSPAPYPDDVRQMGTESKDREDDEESRKEAEEGTGETASV